LIVGSGIIGGFSEFTGGCPGDLSGIPGGNIGPDIGNVSMGFSRQYNSSMT
jgi:hypothetical protein